MAPAPKIAVIGSNMMDMVTRVDRLPRLGETLAAKSFDIFFGGKGANQAVAAAKLGADVLMITKVGDDIFGPGYVRNFREQGVDVRHVKPVPGEPNGVASIAVDADANNAILISLGANRFLLPADIDAAADDLARCGLILLQLEMPMETVHRAIRFGAERGIPVLLNPAPAVTLDFDVIRSVTFLAPNETELEILSGMPVGGVDEARAAARTLLDRGIENLLVTLGGKGALCLRRSGEETYVPPLPVTPVDTTGAGDAFLGSFAYHLLALGDVEKAAIMANRYAAASIQKPGAQQSYPAAAEFAAMTPSCLKKKHPSVRVRPSP